MGLSVDIIIIQLNYLLQFYSNRDTQRIEPYLYTAGMFMTCYPVTFLIHPHVSSSIRTYSAYAGINFFYFLGNDPLLREALNLWEANTTCPLPPEEMRGRQRRWDELLTQKTHEDLLEAATDSITQPASCQQLLRSQEPG